jgi:hypothetical protein
MIKITEITICTHCGSNQEVVSKQVEMLSPLQDRMKVHWNHRLQRYPKAYPSYSQLVNHAIATCPTEFMIMLNDRTTPHLHQAEKIIDHLENGFACSMFYNVAYMGLSKELVRKIGWWDERFLGGGWEDRDWVFRMKHADLALYESQEGTYDMSWKASLQSVPASKGCKYSDPHWYRKYVLGNYIVKVLPEEKYEHWNLFLGEPRPDISSSWKKWSDSILNVEFGRQGGSSSSSIISNRNILEILEPPAV